MEIGKPTGISAQRLNLYVYVQNNLLKYVDPTGYLPEEKGTYDYYMGQIAEARYGNDSETDGGAGDNGEDNNTDVEVVVYNEEEDIHIGFSKEQFDRGSAWKKIEKGIEQVRDEWSLVFKYKKNWTIFYPTGKTDFQLEMDINLNPDSEWQLGTDNSLTFQKWCKYWI